MKQRLLSTVIAFFLSANFISAQFFVNDITFSANSVSNQGKISGYQYQGGPYAIWLPDSANNVILIGGIAPGFGVGGQGRFSTDGNFLCGTSMGAVGAEMSIFSRITDQWTALGSLGFSVDSSYGGGYAISGDGNTVVGLSWADTTGGLAFAHAVASNPIEGIMDLGTLFAGRSTRANAVNHDGSVVVGWQDFNGPWKSAVWKKNPSGGYYANEYILLDTLGSPSDEFNQMGECSAISASGDWIGGYGDYANNNEPWIWSKDSGVINLGTLPNVGNGFVSGMSADGSIVVGWFDGQLFGDPQTPFIWTHTGGLHELNDYILNVLGDSTGMYQVYSAESISPDGHYVAGYGVNNTTFNYFVFRVSLGGSTGIHNAGTFNSMKAYPNPNNGMLTIENLGHAEVSIKSIDGRLLYKKEMNDKLSLDISGYESGIYLLSLQSGSLIQTQKIIKK